MPGRSGTLILIGGNEDRSADGCILREVANRVQGGPLVVATLASDEPDWQWETYGRIFRELGVHDVRHLGAANREALTKSDCGDLLVEAKGVFFTGGDQLKITTKLGGTSAYDHIRALYKTRGGVLAGTSAGAAAMGQMMLMSPEVEGSGKHKLGRAFIMARGLGFTRDMVIDQHFAQRARIERLLGAMAENPGVLGIGIDEDTAVIVNGSSFDVIGSGAVYVADGSKISYTNASQDSPDRILCLLDVRLHVLCHGLSFDMSERQPSLPARSPSRSEQKRT
jgi:cyanophycinase